MFSIKIKKISFFDKMRILLNLCPNPDLKELIRKSKIKLDELFDIKDIIKRVHHHHKQYQKKNKDEDFDQKVINLDKDSDEDSSNESEPEEIKRCDSSCEVTKESKEQVAITFNDYLNSLDPNEERVNVLSNYLKFLDDLKKITEKPSSSAVQEQNPYRNELS